MSTTKPTLLTIPSELRNNIYTLVFDPDFVELKPVTVKNPLAAALQLDYVDPSSTYHIDTSKRLDPLRTCRQMHHEAHLLAISLTPFHIGGDCTYPELFDKRSRPLSAAKIGAIRQLTLTARIALLRAMNETWAGVPFGHPHLRLDKLTIIPRRPDTTNYAYAEVADLSQCHTLAYIFAETLKTLRNVRTIEVQNNGCFSDVVWRVLYKSLIFRMWRWGGNACGVTFECSPETEDAGGTNGWFKMHIRSLGSAHVEALGNEVGAEVIRLAGHEAHAMRPTAVVNHDDGH